jgi:hypothetical protein
MLNIRSYSDHTGIVVAMSEIAVQAASVKLKLLEISKQAAALAAGLQNAAPGEKDTPNPSIQYLTSISDALTNIAEECEALINSGSTSSSAPGT